MTISLHLVTDRSRLRRWQLDLGLQMAADAERLSISFADGPALASAIELLLDFERLAFGLSSPRGSDRMEHTPHAQPRQDMCVTLDFSVSKCGGPSALCVLYDGCADETALFGALLQGRAPLIEVQHVDSGRVLAHGRPSFEGAEHLTEAYECVTSRVATLVRKAIDGLGGTNEAPSAASQAAPPVMGQVASSQGSALAVARYEARVAAMTAARWLYRLCTHAPHWRIGWRMVEGAGVLERGDLGGIPFRNLPDPGVRFFADPFPMTWCGETWIFYEDFDHRTQKGVISAVPCDANGPCGPARTVLETPWHLSYPFLIEDGGELWMLPESSAGKTLRLYRAAPFPHRWVEEAILMDGVDISDATLHRHGSRFWMFASTRDGAGAPSDTLSIFSAEQLAGPWLPHAANPVLIDAGGARPAGKMEMVGGRLFRPIQDCTAGYGKAIHIAEVTALTQQSFAQEIRCTLRPGSHWPGRRLHTLNRFGPLECIDGSAISMRTFHPPWRATTH